MDNRFFDVDDEPVLQPYGEYRYCLEAAGEAKGNAVDAINYQRG